MKNRIFFKLLAVFLIVIAATAATLDVMIGNAWAASLRNEIERNLSQKALLFSHRVETDRTHTLAEIAAQIGSVVGSNAAASIEAIVVNARAPRSGIFGSAVGLVILLFGASGVFNELQSALNTIWGVAPKPGRGFIGLGGSFDEVHDRGRRRENEGDCRRPGHRDVEEDDSRRLPDESLRGARPEKSGEDD